MGSVSLLFFLLSFKAAEGVRFPECNNLPWLMEKMDGALPVECPPGGGLKDDQFCDSRLNEECMYSINLSKYICCTPVHQQSVPVCPTSKGQPGNLWPSPLGYPCYDENQPCVSYYSRAALCVRSAGAYDGLVCCSYRHLY